jgi:hypothetical protein
MANQRNNLAIQIQTPGGDNPLLLSLVSAGPYYRGVAVSGLALVGKGGTSPYSYSIISSDPNVLPDGLSVDALSGRITGTPTTAGRFTFIAQVADSSSATFAHSFSITIQSQLFWRGPPPPKGEIDLAYSYQFRVYDASGTLLTSGFTYDGTLPAGLTLDTHGLLSGTPTDPAGISYATVHATDGTDTLDIPITIEIAEKLSISVGTPGDVIIIGQPFSFVMNRTGGVDPVTYIKDPDYEGFWVDWATLDPITGIISGFAPSDLTPGGFYVFEVRAQDALGATDTDGGFRDVIAPITRIEAGDNISVDYTDPRRPIVSSTGGSGVTYTEAGIVASYGAIGGDEILIGASETRSMSTGEYDYSTGTSDTWQLWVSPVPSSGTFTVDIRKRAFGNTLPGSGDSICASALPSLSGNSTDFTSSGSTSTWTDAPIARGDMVSVVPTVNTAGVTWFALFIPARRNF